jgi:3'-5' exonuclease
MELLKNILFIDIETVSITPEYSSLTGRMQAEWDRKSKYLKSNVSENAEPSMLFNEKAGIFSEFAKVVCISFGSFQHKDNHWSLRLKSITNDNEHILLTEFCEMLGRFTAFYPDLRFCGHNIKEFDIPFLCRRMIINGIGLPNCMQLTGKKPWEISHLDTMELWRFGDYKHFTSLSLLAAVLDIPSPKNDIDGSMVGDVYWKEGDLPRIARYCMQDVFTSAKVFLKLKGINDIAPEPVYLTD